MNPEPKQNMILQFVATPITALVTFSDLTNMFGDFC